MMDVLPLKASILLATEFRFKDDPLTTYQTPQLMKQKQNPKNSKVRLA